MNFTLNIKENSSVIAMKINKRIISKLDEKANQNSEDQQKADDKLIEKVKKKNEINEEFVQKQKELMSSASNVFMNDSNDFNIYKKIINISLSLIVVGLLMGILLGLILVMYLNSRSSK
jgi:Zn-dependent M32 family carboxypeptidase